MSSRFFVAAVATIAVSVGMVGVPAMAGNDSRPSARVSVLHGPAETTLTVDVPAAATGAELHVSCPASGRAVTAVAAGVVQAVSVPPGCDDYALLIAPAAESR